LKNSINGGKYLGGKHSGVLRKGERIKEKAQEKALGGFGGKRTDGGRKDPKEQSPNGLGKGGSKRVTAKPLPTRKKARRPKKKEGLKKKKKAGRKPFWHRINDQRKPEKAKGPIL